MTPARTLVDRTVTDLHLSRAAVDMARQLALPDGKVVFTRHPLTNQPDAWEVGGRRLYQGLPYRQLLAYGMAEVAPCDPPYVVYGPAGAAVHPWQVVLTEAGRAWVAAGCPPDVAPPVTAGPKRRRPVGRMMRRRIA